MSRRPRRTWPKLKKSGIFGSCLRTALLTRSKKLIWVASVNFSRSSGLVQSRPSRLHLGLRPGAGRDEREADVDEDAVAVGEELHRLLDLAAEIVEIGRVEVEEGPAGAERLAALADELALRRHHAPARMLARRELVPAGREVDRRVDAGAVQGVDLRAQQVEVEVADAACRPWSDDTTSRDGTWRRR